jgi:hypothetical protein
MSYMPEHYYFTLSHKPDKFFITHTTRATLLATTCCHRTRKYQ